MKRSRPIVGMSLGALVSLVFLSSCGGSGYSSPTSPASPTPPPAPADVTIMISGIAGGMSFSPASAALKAGQTVAWTNADSITHAIAQDGGGFSTPAIPGGTTSAPITVTVTGALGYHCSIHPSMTGNLVVTQ
jgi:plastocyanin